MILLARLFTPAPDREGAEVIGRRLLEILAEFSPVVSMPPEQYWKLPAWYEHTLQLTPADESTFDRVLAMAGGGWHDVLRDGECYAVWGPVTGASFLLPEVTWAELRLIHPPRRYRA